jgi:hypothetical protein
MQLGPSHRPGVIAALAASRVFLLLCLGKCGVAKLSAMKTPGSAKSLRVVLVIAAAICGLANRSVLGDPPNSPDRPQIDEELRCEILYRRDVDQEARMAIIRSGFFQAELSALQKIADEIDLPNTNRMKQIVAQYGWPGKSLVGQDGAGAAWLLVQHTEDLCFMQQCLALMEVAAANGEASRRHLALLTDRVRWRQGKPQLYGTQFVQSADGRFVPHTIEDEVHVDERRKSLGFEPMAEYEKSLRATYGTQAISRQ